MWGGGTADSAQDFWILLWSGSPLAGFGEADGVLGTKPRAAAYKASALSAGLWPDPGSLTLGELRAMLGGEHLT